jgi:organic hydroperoxide reductase OsmC/OhrA
MNAHTYECTLSWHGSTAQGYDAYSRTHRVAVPPAEDDLVLSSDPGFNGDGRLPNPEQLLLAAVSSCQLLTFLAIAARSRVDVLAYEDHADAVMPNDEKPMRITRVTLRPRVTVAAGADLDRVRRMLERAHDTCFIANTLNATIAIDAHIEHGSPRPAADARKA